MDNETFAEFTFDVDYHPKNIIMKIVASNVKEAVGKIPALLSQEGVSGAINDHDTILISVKEL